MTTARIRPLLAATTVAAAVFYGLCGHALPHVSDDGTAGAAAGLCLLLATAVALAAAPEPAARHRAGVAGEAWTCVAVASSRPLEGRARASPIALQRFRN